MKDTRTKWIQPKTGKEPQKIYVATKDKVVEDKQPVNWTTIHDYRQL